MCGDGEPFNFGLIFDNPELCSTIVGFTQDEYLFIGTVNRAFYVTYQCAARKRTKTTAVALCFESVSRLKDSGICNVAHISSAEYIYRCNSIEVMRHARDASVLPDLNGALEHAIRSNDQDLIRALEEKYSDARVGPACLIAAVESGSLELVKRNCADDVLDRRAANFGLRDSYFFPFDLSAKATICDEWKTYVGEYLVEAAKLCHFLHILTWLHSQGM